MGAIVQPEVMTPSGIETRTFGFLAQFLIHPRLRVTEDLQISCRVIP